jgi:TPR repeat protein
MKNLLLYLTIIISTLSASELEHMQKACDNKMPTACYEFGLLYEKGVAVTKNTNKAKAYYLQACEYGFDEACKRFETIKVIDK